MTQDEQIRSIKTDLYIAQTALRRARATADTLASEIGSADTGFLATLVNEAVQATADARQSTQFEPRPLATT